MQRSIKYNMTPLQRVLFKFCFSKEYGTVRPKMPKPFREKGFERFPVSRVVAPAGAENPVGFLAGWCVSRFLHY
jgi:hypothetical protein